MIQPYAYNTGHRINVRFVVLYIDTKFNIGYNIGSNESTTFICQYSTPHSDTGYNRHTISISDIKAAADRASVDSGYQIVGWTKTSSSNPTVYPFSGSTTACNKGDTIYLVAKVSSSSSPYITINHQYYTNGTFDGQNTVQQAVTAPNYNVPKTIYNSDIIKQYSYNGNTYSLQSINSNPSTVTVVRGATGYQGTFTLRYNRTVQNYTYNYKLTWDYNGGRVGDDTERTRTVSNVETSTYTFYEDTQDYGSPRPTREGYTFTGWIYKNDDTYTGGKFNESNGQINMTGINGETVSGTLIAQWKEISNIPIAPKREDLYGILGNFVNVRCVSEGEGLPHDIKSYSVIGNWNDAVIGEVYKKTDDIYYCEVTLYGETYKTFYEFEPVAGTRIQHMLVTPDETKTISLKYDTANKKWKSAGNENEDTPLATFDVVCKEDITATECLTVKKIFVGLDEVPKNFSINWEEVHGDDSNKITTKVLKADNAISTEIDKANKTIILTWKVPHYYNTGASTPHIATVTENCDVDGYSYNTTVTQSSWKVNGHTLTRLINDNISASTLTITNTYNLINTDVDYRIEWYDKQGNSIKETSYRTGTKDEIATPTDDDYIIDGYIFDENDYRNILSKELKENEENVLKLYFYKVIPTVNLHFKKNIAEESDSFEKLKLNKDESYNFFISLTNQETGEVINGLLDSKEGFRVNNIPIGTYIIEEQNDIWFSFVSIALMEPIEGIELKEEKGAYIITIGATVESGATANIEVTNKPDEERFYDSKYDIKNLFTLTM